MFSKEYRPLKRPKLGVPDYYPQDTNQKEDELSHSSLTNGFRVQPTIPIPDELGGALKDFNQHFLNPKEYSVKVNQVVEDRKRRRWVHDSEKKKLQITRDNFFPVPLGRNRKEIATQWFNDLASSKSLSLLAKKVPIFNKKEEIFDNLCEKDVPISRAAWYIKMTSAYYVIMTDSKLNKKKQPTDPSYDWTVSLTKYMQEGVWRICNESMLMGRHDSHGGSRNSSTSHPPSPSDETLTEIRHWQYLLHLSSWLYEDNLLDKHEFVRWLVERIEHVKSGDTKALQLYLPLVLRHLLDVAHCVSLARPLINYCCERLAALFEMEQRVHKIAPKSEPHSQLERVVQTKEDDSVFNEVPIIKQDPGRSATSFSKASESKQRRRKSSSGEKKSAIAVAAAAAAAVEADKPKESVVTSVANGVNHEADILMSYFHWCGHHQSVTLQLICIIQIVAITCPTAFVQVKVSSGRGSLGRDAETVVSPLAQLPYRLSDMPLPPNVEPDLQKKFLSSLMAAEQDITQRSKVAESRWSSMTVADMQTTSEGSNVRKILRLLEVLDAHPFNRCWAHNALTTLYCHIAKVQRSNDVPLSDEMFTMLMCQWAVTPHRAGSHRPLAAARILWQRQNDIIKGEGWREEYDKDFLDECWEGSIGVGRLYDTPYPLQSTLFKFLDSRAPLPDDLSAPMQVTDPFFRFVILFAELIRLDVFSYNSYLSTLIARGETRPPIIPCLPFARNGVSEKSGKRQHSEPLNLSIPLPALKKAKFEPAEVSMSLGPPSPVSSNNFSGIGGYTLDSILTVSDSSESSNGRQQDDPNGNENASILEERAQKLRMLVSEHNTSQLSQLMSPLGFNSPSNDTDAPNSPNVPSKTDLFNFSMSLFTEDDDMPLNKHASRHLIFAAYFPIADSHLTQQTLNERFVVLCGIGKARNKVEVIIKKVTDDVEHYFRLLKDIQTPVLPEETRLQNLMTSYQSLPTFEQNLLATSCEKTLRCSLGRRGNGKGSPYPACAQLVFVCELLKVCGSTHQILQLLVDVVACNASLETDEEMEAGFEERQPTGPHPPLPFELCLPVIGLFQKYFTCLLMSQQDTTVIFDRLFHVLSGMPPKGLSSNKSLFFFLHQLYTNCSYLQKTFQTTFGPYCVQFGETFGVSIEWHSPTSTEAEWQRTAIVQQLAKPSICDIPQLCILIKNGIPPYSKPYFTFVVDVFTAVWQKSIQTLSDLATICAVVCYDHGPRVNSELLGAFRALCIPNMTTLKTGFSALTNKSNILMDTGIHSNLLVFVCLLVSHNIFHLHDVIIYIITAMIRVQLMKPAPGASQQSYRSLEFATSLILHLLVRNYSNGQHSSELNQPVRLPPFVSDCLEAKCRDLHLGHIIPLLKDLLKISQTNMSRERSGNKSGSLLVHTTSSGNETTLNRVRKTLETVASQDWIRDKCSQQGARLLEPDMLGDTSLMPAQTLYLLHLLCPYPPSSFPSDSSQLAKMELFSAVEHILKNLDQWTLRNALLHIDVHVQQSTARNALQDYLASEVIRVFEDSCSDEWLGQTIECNVESGDGSYSPRVWLVTPLISRLQQSVLGRVLKSAGNVLGQGQWWNPEKNQEKRRSTRASSGVPPPKTGLQWQQPFLELVLACMHAQTNTHEELLGPLKSQLLAFLNAYDKEGTPADEQGKTMLYAALKLRLSLVGSMMGSICSSENVTLEWVPLLMQLICSGAVDRQTDSSELFTNTLDMLCTMLRSLPGEFQTCLAFGGEEGKKTNINCVKKIKSELNNAKSYCINEIQQLFPLSQESYTVTSVKQPISLIRSLNKGVNSYSDRIKGLRVQDTREISPWDILEGVKNNGPLLLSWFGGVRMKRKPLKFEEQRWLLRFHTHQDQFREMLYQSNYVKLPESVVPEIEDPTKIPDDGITPVVDTVKPLAVEGTQNGTPEIKVPNSTGVNILVSATVSNHSVTPSEGQSVPNNPQSQYINYRPSTHLARPQQQVMYQDMYFPGRQQMAYGSNQNFTPNKKITLDLIRANALRHQLNTPQMLMRHPQMHNARMEYPSPAVYQQQKAFQEHHNRVAIHHQRTTGIQPSQLAHGPGGSQFNQYNTSVQHQMRPMQANQAMPLQQAMMQKSQQQQQAMMQKSQQQAMMQKSQQGYRPPMIPQQANMMVHPGVNQAQSSMQFPQQQQHPGMSTMHGQMY